MAIRTMLRGSMATDEEREEVELLAVGTGWDGIGMGGRSERGAGRDTRVAWRTYVT